MLVGEEGDLVVSIVDADDDGNLPPMLGDAGEYYGQCLAVTSAPSERLLVNTLEEGIRLAEFLCRCKNHPNHTLG